MAADIALEPQGRPAPGAPETPGSPGAAEVAAEAAPSPDRRAGGSGPGASSPRGSALPGTGADASRRPTPGGGAEAARILVLCHLAGEDYGLDVGWVREIIPWQQVTRVPRTPPFVEGIINLRGHIIPVLDLRRRLGLPEGERDRRTRIVVVEREEAVVGLVVDAVSEVIRLPADAVEPPAQVLAVDAGFVQGIARHGDRLILVLQPDQVLAPPEWEAVRAVQEAGGADASATAGDPGADPSGDAGAADGDGPPAGADGGSEGTGGAAGAPGSMGRGDGEEGGAAVPGGMAS